MQNSRKILLYLTISLSTILILLTLLSLFYNLSYWYSKVLDFPRQQYFLLALVLLLVFLLFNQKWKFPSYFLLLGLLAVIFINGNLLFPYILGEKSVPDYNGKVLDEKTSFDAVIVNVLVTNRKSKELIKILKLRKPDLLLIMEVDDWWIKELRVVTDNYPYKMEYPLDNAYGMSLYSKLPLKNARIEFLKHNDVPSFHSSIELPSGESFILHAVHPVAPVPSNKYPDNVGEEEIELLKIGTLISRNKLPAMVAGDFNDVSWSKTSRMFGEKGNLKNVRIGRGFFNTFDATSIIQRWPLDHFFVTKEFALVELERMPKFGSDHFPLYAKFVFED